MMRLVCIVVLSCIIAAPAVQSKTLRVYHVGNSVTDTIRYNAMEQLAKASNNRYIFGRHMIPGAPLSWIWNHPADGFQQEPYGYYPKALKEFEWDVLTLQPFDRLLEGDDESDLASASKFIDLALAKSPRLTVYI